MAKLSLLHCCEHMYSIFNRTLSSLTIIPAANSLHYSDFFVSFIDAHVLHFCFILFSMGPFCFKLLTFFGWKHALERLATLLKFPILSRLAVEIFVAPQIGMIKCLFI